MHCCLVHLANLSLHAVGYAGLLISVLVLVFPQNAAELLGLSAGSVTSTILLGLLAVGSAVLSMVCLSGTGWGKNKSFQINAALLGFISLLWLISSNSLLSTLVAWEVLSWSGLMMVVGEGNRELASSYYGWAMASGLAFMFAVAGQALGQNWWLLALTLGVLIKLGMFGFHGWMIKVYGESSPVVGAVFSGILSLGAVVVTFKYGVENYLMFPVVILAGVQIIYGGLIALGKENLRENIGLFIFVKHGLLDNCYLLKFKSSSGSRFRFQCHR